MPLRSYLQRMHQCPPSTIADVHQALAALNTELAGGELARLRNFNQTYQIITRNVLQAVRRAEFDRPDFLRRFDCRFALYYFGALEAFLNGRPVPPAWRAAFQAAQRPTSSSLKVLALGVNAHIANDIPQVLLDSRADERDWPDYRLVDQVIRTSLDETIVRLETSRRLLSPHRRGLRWPAKITMAGVTWAWRYAAWRQAGALRRGSHVNRMVVERRADRMARLVQLLPI